MKAAGSAPAPGGAPIAEHGARTSGKRPVHETDSSAAAALQASLSALPRLPQLQKGGLEAGTVSPVQHKRGGSGGSLALVAGKLPVRPEEGESGATAEPRAPRTHDQRIPVDGTLRILSPSPPEGPPREDQLIRAAWRQATTQVEGVLPEPAISGRREGASTSPPAPQRVARAGLRTPETPPLAGPSPATQEPTGAVSGSPAPRGGMEARGAAMESARHHAGPRALHLAVDRASPAPPRDTDGGPAPSHDTRPLNQADAANTDGGSPSRAAESTATGPSTSADTPPTESGDGSSRHASAQSAPRDSTVAPGPASSGASARAAFTSAQAPVMKAWSALLEQVQGRLEALRAMPGEVLRLELEPRELGRLELSLRRQGGGWVLELRADQAGTAAELRNQAQDLYDRVSGTGLRLEDLRVVGPQVAGAAEAPETSRPAAEADPALDGRRGGHGREEPGAGPGEERDPEGSADPGPKREDFASRLERELRRREGEAA